MFHYETVAEIRDELSALMLAEFFGFIYHETVIDFFEFFPAIFIQHYSETDYEKHQIFEKVFRDESENVDQKKSEDLVAVESFKIIDLENNDIDLVQECIAIILY